MAEPIAIVSDEHGILQGLEDALEMIEERGITRIYSGGDAIGYGGETIPVVDRVMQLTDSVLGNHEEALKYVIQKGLTQRHLEFQMAKDSARSIMIVNGQIRDPIIRLDYLQKKLQEGKTLTEEEVRGLNELPEKAGAAQKRIDFLCNLPDAIQIDENVRLIHAPRDSENPNKMHYVVPGRLAKTYGIPEPTEPATIAADPAYFPDQTRILLLGHSHVPFIRLFDDQGNSVKSRGGSKVILRKGERAIVGIGSTGLSRRQSTGNLEVSSNYEKPLISNYTIIGGDRIEIVNVLSSYAKAEEITTSEEVGMSNPFAKLLKK